MAAKNKKNIHVMVDLETLDTRQRSAILSLGAVVFQWNIPTENHQTHREFPMGLEFHQNIRLEECLDIGMTANSDTLEWWFNQPTEIQKALFNPSPHSLEKVLKNFTSFLSEASQQTDLSRSKEYVYIWGNGARFDLGILAYAYEQKGLELPWNFRNERDVRTILGLYHTPFGNTPRTGPHNPVEDCSFQIKCLEKVAVAHSIPEPVF